LKEFSEVDTRYVWVEFNAHNLCKDGDFLPCELDFNFYTETGLLKGHIHKLMIIYPQDELINCTVGWGLDESGSWYKGQFRMEVIFMNHLIASVNF